MATTSPPDNLISYGLDANCTLAICPVEWSVYEYQPSLAASGTFIALFGICMLLHVAQGVYYRTWGFMTGMILGCISEIIGYIGRIMLYHNPFSFTGFMIQICCITFAPVFFTAAIYVLLADIIKYLDRSLSRFRPSLFYYVFITCDVISLTLQGAGGGLSSSSSGSSQVGVDVALAGLSFQVVCIVVFCALAADYAIRFRKATNKSSPLITRDFKIFVSFVTLAIVLILTRCAYRIDELSDGYYGPLIHDQGLFIGLEGVMIIAAAFVLNLGHPGRVFSKRARIIGGDPAYAEKTEGHGKIVSDDSALESA